MGFRRWQYHNAFVECQVASEMLQTLAAFSSEVTEAALQAALAHTDNLRGWLLASAAEQDEAAVGLASKALGAFLAIEAGASVPGPGVAIGNALQVHQLPPYACLHAQRPHCISMPCLGPQPLQRQHIFHIYRGVRTIWILAKILCPTVLHCMFLTSRRICSMLFEVFR